MRCFVAVDIPEDLKQRLVQVQQEFTSFDAKLVNPENMHFTLKFLGELSEEQATDVKQKLADLASTQKPFNIHLSGMGAFPSLSYIRVVWIGALSDDFFNLHRAVVEALSVGKNDETTPHLTIARIRSPRGKDIISKIIKRYEKESVGTMTVDKISLKKSTLTPRGPVYEDIATYELDKN